MQSAGTQLLPPTAATRPSREPAGTVEVDGLSDGAEPRLQSGDERSAPDLSLVRSEPEPTESVPVAVAVVPEGGGEMALAGDRYDFEEVSAAFWISLKRAVDVLVSAAALLVLLPVFLVIGAMIKLTDGGPIFFAQRRVGLRGQTFQMLKFRSMVVHAERLRPRLEIRNESSGPVFKMRLDPRVTPIGKFIRKYSLDELPQLINVLLGEMSLVGPRPSLPSEVARYQRWQYRRFAVKPGLTCLWQVSPRRYQISFDEWMKLDLKYVDDWSLRLDLDLILRTFGVVLGGTGE